MPLDVDLWQTRGGFWSAGPRGLDFWLDGPGDFLQQIGTNVLATTERGMHIGERGREQAGLWPATCHL
jgi:hypothetical protein